MTCIICQTRYYDQSFSSPAEPCDCGANWSPEGDTDPKDIATARAAWNAAQRGEHVCANYRSEDEPERECSTPLLGVADYYDGRLKEPDYLCTECRDARAEQQNEVAQGDAWDGGFAENH